MWIDQSNPRNTPVVVVAVVGVEVVDVEVVEVEVEVVEVVEVEVEVVEVVVIGSSAADLAHPVRLQQHRR